MAEQKQRETTAEYFARINEGKPAPPKALPPDFMGARADHFVAAWFVNVQHLDVEIRDLFLPPFWRHHIKKLRRFDVVRVVGRDFDAQVTVQEFSGFGCTVAPLNWVRPGSAMAQMLDELMSETGPAAESQAAADLEVAGMARGNAS